jgi:hypothetical protein
VESDCWGTAVGQQSCRAGSVCCNDGNQLGSLINGPEQLVVQFQYTNGSAMRVQLIYAEISGLAPGDRVSFIFTTAPGDPAAQADGDVGRDFCWSSARHHRHYGAVGCWPRFQSRRRLCARRQRL